MNISATILAAGSSQRMHGNNKLLLPFKDKTLINAVCQTIIDSHLEPIFVVTGFENNKVAKALPKSIDKAIISLPKNIDGNMIILGDMPLIKVETINRLREAFLRYNGKKIIYANHFGKQVNPVIFPKKYFNEILLLDGDIGCKNIITQNIENSFGVSIDSSEVIFDCDTKKDYSELVSMKLKNV